MKVNDIESSALSNPPARTKIVVEVGQAFEGSESFAHAFVDEVANAGADAIKFQLHIAEDESSLNDVFRTSKRYRRESRFEYWKRNEISPGLMNDLIAHSRERSLEIGFSTFSLEGLERISASESDFLKIGSGESIQPWFLRAAAEVDLPILLSTGLSKMADIRVAIELLAPSRGNLTLMQCVTKYPSELGDVGLNMISEMRQEFGVEVGLSDHSGRLAPGLFAIASGASVVEVHGTFSKKTQNPDAEASLEFAELSLLCSLRDDWENMVNSPVEKDKVAEQLEPMRQVFGRSLAARVALPEGACVEARHVYFAKPGGGLPAENLGELLGQTLARPVSANAVFEMADFEK